jgi:hypothetical protein
VIFDRYELTSCVNSIKHILESAQIRMDNIESTCFMISYIAFFSQTLPASYLQRSPTDTDATNQFSKFAFGIVSATYKLGLSPSDAILVFQDSF